jgi:hypothetical protein
MDDIFLFEQIEIENFHDIVNEFNSVIESYRKKNQYNFNLIDKDSFLKDCDLVKKYFDDNECVITNIATIEIAPKSKGTLHTDNYRNTLALNFPVFNCEDSYTSLYKIVEGEPALMVYPNGLTHTDFGSCSLSEIARYTIRNKAILFNTKVPHRVFNNSDKPRLAVSFRFAKDPWHLIAVSKCRNVLLNK